MKMNSRTTSRDNPYNCKDCLSAIRFLFPLCLERFFISYLRSSVFICGRFSSSNRPAGQESLHDHEQQQQDADGDTSPPGAELSLKGDGGLDDAEDERADQRAGDAADAAGEKRSADDDGGDGVELEARR